MTVIVRTSIVSVFLKWSAQCTPTFPPKSLCITSSAIMYCWNKKYVNKYCSLSLKKRRNKSDGIGYTKNEIRRGHRKWGIIVHPRYEHCNIFYSIRYSEVEMWRECYHFFLVLNVCAQKMKYIKYEAALNNIQLNIERCVVHKIPWKGRTNSRKDKIVSACARYVECEIVKNFLLTEETYIPIITTYSL